MAELARRDLAPIAGIILAAGRSRRMGATKQLLSYDGAPMLQLAVDVLAASDVVEIIVVLGHQADEVRAAVSTPSDKPLRFVVCEDYARGQSASLACGLSAVADNIDAAALILADQPELDVVLVDRALAAWRAAFEPVVRPLFRAEDGQSVPGHPVVFDRSVWGALRAQTGDQGARLWMREHAEYVRNIEIDATAPGDVDTWEDYLRIAARLRAKNR
jgi:molybdenum cofactor cytidylyltransferase